MQGLWSTICGIIYLLLTADLGLDLLVFCLDNKDIPQAACGISTSLESYLVLTCHG